MVLDDASPTQGDSFYNDASESGGMSETNQNTYNIDTEHFPKSVPILGPMFGFTVSSIGKITANRISVASQLLGRAPTQEEAEALAYHLYRDAAIASYGIPTGLAVGLRQARATAAIGKFPFYPAPSNFDPNVFKVFQTELRGDRARLVRTILRSCAYATTGGVIGSLLFASLGASLALAGAQSDDRLKDFNKEMGQRARENRKQQMEQRTQRVDQQSGRTRGQSDDQNASQRIQNLEPRPVERSESMYGGYRSKNNTGFSDSPTDNSSYDGSYQEPLNSGSQNTTSSSYGFGSPARSRSSRTPQPQPQGQATSDFFESDFDDASPTQQPSDTPYSGGSSWERIRKGRSVPPQNSQNNRPRENNRSSRSSDDTTPQERAQREFDQQVERERHGKDFGGKGQGGQW